MSWRNQSSHRQETREVKAALLKVGVPVRSVGHGKGTAWGWLEISLDWPQNCDWQKLRAEAIHIARQVTGREGEYDGKILVK
mgnify:CR=1 FL=1